MKDIYHMFEETKYPVISAFSGFTFIIYCHDSKHNPGYVIYLLNHHWRNILKVFISKKY